MPRRVLVQSTTGKFDLVEVPALSEQELQDVVKANPRLLPADDLGFDGDLLVIGRETTLASGSIDLMCLARSGDVVLVEFKTGPKNPDFRHALAQLIDYGSDLWRLSRQDFDAVVQRYLRGGHCLPAFKNAENLHDSIGLTNWHLTEGELESLYLRLDQVLADGDFTYVIAAQRFTAPMQASLEYMNETMRFGRFYLIEVVSLKGNDLTAYAAQVVARPTRKSTASGAAQTSEAEFLGKIEDEHYRQAMKEIFTACHSLGMTVYWGSGGSSLRIATPDRSEPLSIGWAFLDGAQWYSAKHLTLGVDPTALQKTPSVASAVNTFIGTVGHIHGATKTPGKLSAYTFAPEAVPAAKEPIITAIEELVADVNGSNGSDA